MRAFHDEFQQRLQKPEMEEWLVEISKKTDNIILILSECIKKSVPFSMKELEEVIAEMISGKACGPDGIPPELFIHGGKKLLTILLEMVNEIKSTSMIPSQWNDVDITTLYKHKGKQKDLKNQRGIFLTSIVYKLYERLLNVFLHIDLLFR